MEKFNFVALFKRCGFLSLYLLEINDPNVCKSHQYYYTIFESFIGRIICIILLLVDVLVLHFM